MWCPSAPSLRVVSPELLCRAPPCAPRRLVVPLRELQAWIPLDDVRHAYGALSHDTVSADVPDTDARILQSHDRRPDIHMGGTSSTPASDMRLGAGTGRGCPISGLKYCVYKEVKGREACRGIPPARNPGGELHGILLMDDTQRLPDSSS